MARYSLLMHYSESGGAELTPEAMAEWRQSFHDYTTALDAAGVLLIAEVLSPSTESETLTLRDSARDIHDGPFALVPEQLGGYFLIDVPDKVAALEWAEKCPAAHWGTIEVRPSATYFKDGEWR